MRRPVLAAALLISLSACQAIPFGQQMAETPKPAPAAVSNPTGFEPVPGRWQVGKAANLRAGPSTDFPIVGGIKAGQALEVLGKVPGAEWFAIRMGDRHAYIHTRLVHQMDEPPPVTQTTIVAVPAPVKQAAVMQTPVMQAPPRAVQVAPVTAPEPPAAVPAPAPAPVPPPPAPAVTAPSANGEWVATGAPVSFKPIAR
jgi:Bacterial SH3 domain